MSALGTALRLCAVAGAAAALAASGSSSANRPPPPDPSTGGPPPDSRPMESEHALGLWKSSFGPVKIERDVESGPDHLMGIWVYDRSGQEVVGYFSGPLSGNVMQFRWQEPARPRDLVGEGYLVFDPRGRSFNGRWWTVSRDRGGDWNGWRSDGSEGEPPDGPPGPPDPEGRPPEGEEPPEGEPPPDDDRPRREDGPAEQAPGPPPEDV